MEGEPRRWIAESRTLEDMLQQAPATGLQRALTRELEEAEERALTVEALDVKAADRLVWSGVGVIVGARVEAAAADFRRAQQRERHVRVAGDAEALAAAERRMGRLAQSAGGSASGDRPVAESGCAVDGAPGAEGRGGGEAAGAGAGAA